MRGQRGEQGEGREDWGGNGQVSEEAQNGNKEGAGSDPRGIPAERQQEWWGVAASAMQKTAIKKLHLVLLAQTVKSSCNTEKPKQKKKN